MNQNLRRTRTTRYLIDALIEIAEEKNIRHATVRELCARAQVNRTTFYKHYDGMQDFLDQIIQDFLAQMTLAVDRENPFIGIVAGKDPTLAFNKCVVYMDENAPFLRMMFGRNGSLEFQHQIRDAWTTQLTESLLPFAQQLEEKTSVDVLACYISSAMMGLLNFYLQPNNRYSQTHMASQMKALIYDGVLAWALNRTPTAGTRNSSA